VVGLSYHVFYTACHHISVDNDVVEEIRCWLEWRYR